MLQFLRSALDAFSVRLEARREARRRFRTARDWKFVHAHGPEQTLSPEPMTHSEALKFLRFALRGRYLQTDFAGSIIFYATARAQSQG